MTELKFYNELNPGTKETATPKMNGEKLSSSELKVILKNSRNILE